MKSIIINEQKANFLTKLELLESFLDEKGIEIEFNEAGLVISDTEELETKVLIIEAESKLPIYYLPASCDKDIKTIRVGLQMETHQSLKFPNGWKLIGKTQDEHGLKYLIEHLDGFTYPMTENDIEEELEIKLTDRNKEEINQFFAKIMMQ